MSVVILPLQRQDVPEGEWAVIISRHEWDEDIDDEVLVKELIVRAGMSEDAARSLAWSYDMSAFRR